jgi:hypothetical protein
MLVHTSQNDKVPKLLNEKKKKKKKKGAFQNRNNAIGFVAMFGSKCAAPRSLLGHNNLSAVGTPNLSEGRCQAE